MLQRIKKIFEGYVKWRFFYKLREIEFEAEQKQLKDRVKIENELHKELITEIASVQNEVARKKIDDFKNKHL